MPDYIDNIYYGTSIYFKCMTIRLDTKAWVRRAKKIWGEQYDYSHVQYVNAKTKVRVICKIYGHGAWLCNPDNHISKHRGCPKCGGSIKKTFSQFVAEAQKVHGDMYSYPKQAYVNSHTKISIKCRNHGLFNQSPDSHLRGAGCPKCSNDKSSQGQAFEEDQINKILEAKSGGKVTLKKSTYVKMNAKGVVICSEHGEQPPRLMNTIIYGKNPCLQCSGSRSGRAYSTKEFKELIQNRFGDRHKIKSFKYEGKQTKITLVCCDHGPFSLTAGSIYRSPGCPKCSNIASQKNRTQGLRDKFASTRIVREKEWLKKVKAQHKNFYDYSETIYKSAADPVKIICPVHGVFSQTANSHLVAGCRKCADEDLKGIYSLKYFEKNPERTFRPSTLYYIEFRYKDLTFYKVGITTTTIQNRFAMLPKEKIKMRILGKKEYNLYDAWKAESEIQSGFGQKNRLIPSLPGINNRAIRIGPTECFSKRLSKDLVEQFLT